MIAFSHTQVASLRSTSRQRRSCRSSQRQASSSLCAQCLSQQCCSLQVRLDLYGKRKEHCIGKLTREAAKFVFFASLAMPRSQSLGKEAATLSDKAKFIRLVVDGHLEACTCRELNREPEEIRRLFFGQVANRASVKAGPSFGCKGPERHCFLRVKSRSPEKVCNDMRRFGLRTKQEIEAANCQRRVALASSVLSRRPSRVGWKKGQPRRARPGAAVAASSTVWKSC